MPVGKKEKKALQARNFSAHGLYAGDSIDYEEQFMTSQVYECILVRVILKLLKYEGNYIDYGTIGYPERTLTVQAEVKLVKPLSSKNSHFTTNFTTNR